MPRKPDALPRVPGMASARAISDFVRYAPTAMRRSVFPSMQSAPGRPDLTSDRRPLRHLAPCPVPRHSAFRIPQSTIASPAHSKRRNRCSHDCTPWRRNGESHYIMPVPYHRQSHSRYRMLSTPHVRMSTSETTRPSYVPPNNRCTKPRPGGRNGHPNRIDW